MKMTCEKFHAMHMYTTRSKRCMLSTSFREKVALLRHLPQRQSVPTESAIESKMKRTERTLNPYQPEATTNCSRMYEYKRPSSPLNPAHVFFFCLHASSNTTSCESYFGPTTLHQINLGTSQISLHYQKSRFPFHFSISVKDPGSSRCPSQKINLVTF